MISLICLIALAPSTPQKMSAADKVTERYYNFELSETKPPFGLKKVERLIRSIHPVKQEEGSEHILPAKKYNALSFQEKFTYDMLHGEDWSQNCDPAWFIPGAEHKILARCYEFLDDDGAMWSDRQTAFLKNNRAKVIGLLRQTIHARGTVGSNLKQTIDELNAYELIPDVLAVFRKDQKDLGILTLCIMLMKSDNYGPFLKTQTYEKLFGVKADDRSFIAGNDANIKLTIDRAMAYYQSRRHSTS